MANSQLDTAEKPRRRLSLDTWAVLIALAAAVIIRLGLVRVPW
jgi:hypothetical protein